MPLFRPGGASESRAIILHAPRNAAFTAVNPCADGFVPVVTFG
jgi:hypothetical protein